MSLRKIFSFLKSNLSVEKANNYNAELIKETTEFECFNYLYSGFVLDDFATFGKKNFFNKDFEDFVFSDLNYYNVYDILNDDLLCKFIDGVGGENINFLNLAGGVGKLALFINIFYKIGKTTTVENIYELHRLSKYFFAKLTGSEFYGQLLKNDDVNFVNDDLFSVDFGDYNLMVVNYNNNNVDFNEVLLNKIKKECQSGTLIVKIMDPFEENAVLELKKSKILQNDNGNGFFVYFYEVK